MSRARRPLSGVDLLKAYKTKSALGVGDDVLVAYQPNLNRPIQQYVGTVSHVLTPDMIRIYIPALEQSLDTMRNSPYLQPLVYHGPKGAHCDIYDTSSNPTMPQFVSWDGLQLVGAADAPAACAPYPLRTPPQVPQRPSGVFSKGVIPTGKELQAQVASQGGAVIKYEPSDPRLMNLNVKDLRQYMMDRRMPVRDPDTGKLYPVTLLRAVLANQINSDRQRLVDSHQQTIDACEDGVMRAKVTCADLYTRCAKLEKDAPNPRMYPVKAWYDKAVATHAARVQQCKQTRTDCFRDADLFLESPKSRSLKVALQKDIACLKKADASTMNQCRAVAEMQEDRQFYAGPACVAPMNQVVAKYSQLAGRM
jgi:hypothetical protein